MGHYPRMAAASIFLALIVGLTGTVLWLRRHNLTQYALRAGSEFPTLTVQDGAGLLVALSGHTPEGKHVIFYAKPTCGHCSAEMSDLQQSILTFFKGANHGLPAIVLVDPDGADKDNLNDFLQQVPRSLPVFIDFNEELKHRYPATRVPSTFFVLNSGVIDRVIVGERTGNYLLRQIDLFARHQN